MKDYIQQKIDEFVQELGKLHKKYIPSQPEDKVLYHYTSFKNLERIISNQHLTFTHIEDLNDPSESHYAMQTLEGWINNIKNKPTSGNNLLPYREEIWQNFLQILECCLCPEKFHKEKTRGMFSNIKEIKTAIYTLSLSSKQDNLSMWRWYGDNGAGISIGFRSSYFGFGKNHNDVPGQQEHTALVYTPVMYETKDFEKFVRNGIDLYEKTMFEFIDFCRQSTLSDDEKIRNTALLRNELESHLASSIIPLLPAIKHPGYEGEDERRLYYLEFVVRKEDGTESCGVGRLDNDRKLSTHNKPWDADDKRLIVNNKKYVRRYKSEPLDWSNVAEIWIGPRLDFEFTKLEIIKMLKESDYDTNLIDTDCGIRIEKSKMPYQ